MKRRVLLILVLTFAIAILAACNREPEVQPDITFFPFAENLVLHYEVETGDPTSPDFSFTTFNSYIRDGRMQRLMRLNEMPVTLLEVAEIIDGRFVYVIGRSSAF
ncbi:MAG: hypothetical protein FWC67_04720, partial [Defluviitaleaceae bacterium]|nr:hypothetical protein [Defluviitaleaceae bacterium]